MSITLDPIQRRVLGVLIEKSMTTAGSYPLTLTALTTGCNQLSCRDPVMHLNEGEVGAALHVLQRYQLAGQAPPDRNARSNRFLHRVEERFGWDTRERALMAELLLRGPQTPGELKTNASRMSHLDDLQYVMELLAGLAKHETPFVLELPRQPGKAAARWDHCLYPEGEAQAAGGPGAPANVTAIAGAAASEGEIAGGAAAVAGASREAAGSMGQLAERVAVLEQAVADLRAAMAALQDRVGPQV